ncbi:DUF4870 domain-containing protein [Halonotius pteroides]|uniref:DUF4870 domain-containing protein n=1 Tax=Halonotius pteroides TaxID=268735 RepID=A0A3A6Q161_9EURY|nr:hypothetical protein DP106_05445 [Halonotius pteroides]
MLFDKKHTLGIIVHLIGFFFSFICSGIIYILSDNEFNKENSKKSFNWQLSFFIIWNLFASLVFFPVYIFNSSNDLIVLTFILLGGGGMILFGLISIIFCVLATIKSYGGERWDYPLAYGFI